MSEAPLAQARKRDDHGGHLPSLDGIRAIAVLLVMFHQFGSVDAGTGFLAYIAHYGVVMGWIGVQLFFVLSGFLITGILLDSRGEEHYFSAFYARRVLRIFPLYYALLLFFFVLLPLANAFPASMSGDRANQLWLWIWAENWAKPLGVGSHALAHLWSLAVEEQFYLLWPVLIYFCDAKRCLKLCAVVVFVAITVRGWFVLQGAHEDVFYYFSICRMDALALGGAAAAALRLHGAQVFAQQRDRLLVAAIVIGLVGALVSQRYLLSNPIHQWLGYTCLAVMFALVILAAAATDQVGEGGWVSPLRWCVAAEIGKVSYAMYLFHKPMHDFVGKPIAAALGLDVRFSLLLNAAYAVAMIVVVYAAAWLSYHLFEKHFLRMKSYFPSRLRIHS